MKKIILSNLIFIALFSMTSTAQSTDLLAANLANDVSYYEDVMNIEADNDIREKVYQLQEIGEQRKELEKKEKQLKTQIQGYMGDAGLLDAGFCKVALKEIKSTRFNANAFKEKYMELYLTTIRVLGSSPSRNQQNPSIRHKQHRRSCSAR